jgi:GT2 family glycosyltransferase
VVVPCYNYAHYLPACVNSVLDQRDVSVRILIIDDQSPDDTPEVAQALAAADPRVNYVRNEMNLRLIATANRGVMSWATADYVVLLSADDLLTPGALARATALLEVRRDIHMVYGQALIIGEETPADAEDPGDGDYQVIERGEFFRYNCLDGHPVASPAAVVRTSMQQRIGGYDEMLPFASDLDMWLRFASVGPIGVVKQAGAFYRWHSNNASHEFAGKNTIADYAERLRSIEYIYEKMTPKPPELRPLVEQMRRQYALRALWIGGAFAEEDDKKGCEECVAFIDEFAPELRRSSAWIRFEAKRMLGRPGGKALQFLRNRVLGRPTVSEILDQKREWFAREKTFGWWPEGESFRLERAPLE